MMQVKCELCDKVETIEDGSYEAKRLLNKKFHSYLCKICYERIGTNTKKRHETGNFKLYEAPDKKKQSHK